MGLSVTVSVMQVGIMRVLVHQRPMPVRMAVRLACRVARPVRVPVVLVVDVAVLSVDQEKHRISLSLKQISEDPWARAAEKYPAPFAATPARHRGTRQE